MIVAVASGKGGTGKTLVATSLALSLKDSQPVQIVDCDVEEPNAHVFLKPAITETESVYIPVPKVDEAKCTHCGKCSDVCAYNVLAVTKKMVLVFGELCHGCGACSYLCPEQAITEEGREVGVVETGYSDSISFVHGKLNVGEAMAPPVIRKAKERIDPKSTVILDVPPGTSCPVVESLRGCDYCVLVTEPTPFGLNDMALAVGVVRELNVPCGVVLNRAGVGDDKVEEYCSREGIPILLRIPLDIEIARHYSRGTPLVEGIPSWREPFKELFKAIQEQVSRSAVGERHIS